DRLGARRRGPKGDADEHDAGEQAPQVHQLADQIGEAGPVEEVDLDVVEAVLPDARPAEAVEERRAEHDSDERDRPRRRVADREAGEGRPPDELTVLALPEGADAGEQLEVDREAVAVRKPGPRP